MEHKTLESALLSSEPVPIQKHLYSAPMLFLLNPPSVQSNPGNGGDGQALGASTSHNHS